MIGGGVEKKEDKIDRFQKLTIYSQETLVSEAERRDVCTCIGRLDEGEVRVSSGSA